MIRMLFDYAGVDYEDIPVDRNMQLQMKEEGLLEFGQLPVLEYKGKFYSQSMSILRYLGR